MKRAVITGIGIVSPIGTGWKEFWRNALEGKSGVREVLFADAGELPVRIGATVEDFDPAAICPGIKWNRLSRFAQLALAASILAKADAGISGGGFDPERAGVFVGNGMMGMDMLEAGIRALYEKGAAAVTRFGSMGSYPGASAANIAVELGLKGESMTVATGCSSSTNAIGRAWQSIALGDHDLIFAGGSEACLTAGALASMGNAGILSKRNLDPHGASRPFDLDRDGYVLGEGSAIVVLEEREHAQKRGAEAFAEVVGYGSTTDAYSMYSIEPEGLQADRAVRKALDRSGLDSKDIAYVSAHGSSSKASDSRETRVLKRVFGSDVGNVLISSIKSMIGHPLGACGGFQTAVCALALRFGVVHPTINYETPDPDCDLDYVPNCARETRVRAALNLSLGMGGNNAALAMKAC